MKKMTVNEFLNSPQPPIVIEVLVEMIDDLTKANNQLVDKIGAMQRHMELLEKAVRVLDDQVKEIRFERPGKLSPRMPYRSGRADDPWTETWDLKTEPRWDIYKNGKDAEDRIDKLDKLDHLTAREMNEILSAPKPMVKDSEWFDKMMEKAAEKKRRKGKS